MPGSIIITLSHHLSLRIRVLDICNRDRPRFFDQVGHQTTNESIGNIDRLPKIMNLVKDLKILTFKVIFQRLKLVESLQK